MKVFEGTENEFYMDGYLNHNLTTAKSIITKDWDMILAVDGSEGSGKSVLAMQMAFFCDPTLKMERIVFTAREFKQAIIKAKPYQAVIYDEAYTGLSSRSTMGTVNRTLVSMLAEIRQKNLFIFVVMPTFFDLDKYVALWRSRALIHVYTAKNFQRGYFSFYNADKKKFLYIKGKKYYSYGQPKPNFIGRYVNHYVINQRAYRKKKKQSLSNREDDNEDIELKKMYMNWLFEKLIKLDKKKATDSLKSSILGITTAAYAHRKRKFITESSENE